MDGKVVVVGCARDIDSYVYNSVIKMKELGKMFKSYHIVIHENDSKDNTLLFLKTIEMNDKNVTVLSDKNVYGSKTECIAYSRNRILELVKRMNYRPDYYVVMDMDDKSISDPKSLMSCFKKEFIEDDWICIGGNNLGYYYDLWALRTKDEWMPGNMWEYIPYEELKKRTDLFREILPGANPIEVDSCFNGIAIYKYEYIKDVRYNGVECEHVSFNKKLLENNKGKKIYINPQMLVYNGFHPKWQFK